MSFSEFLAKAASIFRKQQLDDDLTQELSSHLDLATDEYIKQGLSPEEARRQALIRLGGVEQAKEGQRDARGVPVLDNTMQDARYALRTLRRDLSFAVFTTMIIAIGVGASATVFSVVNAILVRPLPFKDPQSLIWITNRSDAEDNMSGRTVQVSRLLAFRERNRSFSDVAGFFAFYSTGDKRMTGAGEPERLTSVPVSGNFFPLLGLTPQLGRFFSAEECVWNGPQVVMLSYGFWKRRFAADPGIIGRKLRIDDQPTTVIGVLPESFDFGAVFAPGVQVDMFEPFPLTPETDRWGNTLALVGRIKPGIPLAAAQVEATALGERISDEDRNKNGFTPRMKVLSEYVSGQIRPAILILACAVGVVMLIVCANLSNLMLARTAARQKEMAVRAALGASRLRLIRQLLTESLMLTSFGACLGVVLAFAATIGIGHLTSFKLPLLSSVHVDARVLAFTVVIAMATGIVLGLAPAWSLSGFRLSGSLGQRAGGSHEHNWIRGTLVVSEIAFACVLLVGAGLLVRSFLQVLDVRLGFRPQSAATLRVDPPTQFKTPEQRIAWMDEMLRRAREVGSVDAAGLVDSLPLGMNRTWGAAAKGKDYTKEKFPLAFVRMISDGYVRAMGMSLQQGRDLTALDTQNSTPVMLINETMARSLWPGEDPIGKVVLGACGADRQVVGVIRDVRHMALEKESGNEMYLPMRQCRDSQARGSLVVRSRLPLDVLDQQIYAALQPIAPDIPRRSMKPLAQLVDRAVSPRRFIVSLLSGFALFALLLASLGIYGLISYSVNRRSQEIGIRMALGATMFNVQRGIVLNTLGMAALGIGAGVIASFIVVRSMKGLLYGVPASDPLTFIATVAILAAIAIMAGYLPARRASKIDPMICLRAE